MAPNQWCLLRVPAARAGSLLDSLRDQGIEAKAEYVPAKLEVKPRDLERVRVVLEQTGIGYVIEREPS